MLDITNSYYLWQAGVTLPKGVDSGVAVIEVVASSPAAKAGLQKGDIITKLEGTKVGTVAKLRYELYKHAPGDKIDVTYNRDGKEYTTQIKLEDSKYSLHFEVIFSIIFLLFSEKKFKHIAIR